MPRYYCDYCDVFLAFDSPDVRADHNGGWKHQGNVRNYYAMFALHAPSTFLPTITGQAQPTAPIIPTLPKATVPNMPPR
ncbi:hypothetical protein RCL1_002398 [Eukaryota sp. TZLM3-RCL]